MERNSKLKRFEYWIKARIGKIAFIDIEHRIAKRWYGSDYGGFYVHPDVLHQDSIVYSFGIGQDVSFDKAIIQAHQCQVFGFDPTPKSITWIGEQQLPKQFHFYPVGLGTKTEEVKFHLPKNKDHVSGSVFDHKLVSEEDYVAVPLKSFADILLDTGHQAIDVLKMDIEGSEYVVIESILQAGIPIKQLLLETHERFFEDGREKGERFFQTLYDHGYRIFAISDTYQEISLIKV
ncbi:FkbM family methyltransferase [Sphingobacterium bambusae]|uniref:FkbM family methyltransferase n=1 Tax=Sphingobacterium bambusae TaxID=662858 RepID=A0ABW6BFY2_9SPHI|nr:FkbM family methyltransferase [Sphingobacterium bambusae]WPL50032.1 FkbM family methyltransferase [Sphingobacterium bambusae]